MNPLALLSLLRPHQWFKNLMLLFPPFLAGLILAPGQTHVVVLALSAFCFASSAGYIFNDILDLDNDRCHPHKSKRPLVSGRVSVSIARGFAVLLLILALVLAVSISKVFLSLVIVYSLISLLYSLWLKHQPLLDIFCISTGFVLRLMAGGVAFDVVVSEWLFLSVFLLSLYLSAGKRLAELTVLGEAASGHRRSLAGYPVGYLEGVMVLCGAAVLVTYAIYVLGHPGLVYTVPLCAYGLLRYLFIVKDGASGDPTDALLKDPVLFVVSLSWAGMVSWSLYGG